QRKRDSPPHSGNDRVTGERHSNDRRAYKTAGHGPDLRSIRAHLIGGTRDSLPVHQWWKKDDENEIGIKFNRRQFWHETDHEPPDDEHDGIGNTNATRNCDQWNGHN